MAGLQQALADPRLDGPWDRQAMLEHVHSFRLERYRREMAASLGRLWQEHAASAARTSRGSRLVTETGKGRKNSYEAVILIVSDMLMLQAAFLATYWFRFYSGIWLVPLGIPPLERYVAAGTVITLVFVGIFYAGGMYTNRGRPRPGRRSAGPVQGSGAGQPAGAGPWLFFMRGNDLQPVLLRSVLRLDLRLPDRGAGGGAAAHAFGAEAGRAAHPGAAGGRQPHAGAASCACCAACRGC